MTTGTVGTIVPRLLTQAQVAAMIGVSLAHLKRMRAERRLPPPAWTEAGKGGRVTLVRWDRTHIDLWIDAGRPDEEEIAKEIRALGKRRRER